MSRAVRLVPALAVMALIWFLSDQPHLGTGLSWDMVLRKLAHMAVFGTLLLCWWWAAGPVAAVAVTLGWAVLDEVHQGWVPGRHGTGWDVAVDALGMGVAAALAVWWLRRGRRPAPGALPPRLRRASSAGGPRPPR